MKINKRITFFLVWLVCMSTNSLAQKFVVQAESYIKSSSEVELNKGCVILNPGEWLEFKIKVPEAGRYRISIRGISKEGTVWLEDYVHNTDDRTYNITGDCHFNSKKTKPIYSTIDGSPLNQGEHDIRLHVKQANAEIDLIKFELIQKHVPTPQKLTQSMEGEQWELAWSDEFESDGLPDPDKWSYNIGNWGWGNNELQYYKEASISNSRIENGNLIIEAYKDKNGQWSSARLTTQGKTSFLYGKIEFRAKVPSGRGTWAAGWTLGDEYVDEVSWPYCGEIDILECVGFEIDDSTGKGLNHATCHTRAYYFKQGNQIGSDTTLENMTTEFHTYAVEWYPDVIYGLVDGVRYYTYDKNENHLEWPFDKAQNIIVNLAIGGGWGGAKGLDPNLDHQKYIIDYVRVYQLK